MPKQQQSTRRPDGRTSHAMLRPLSCELSTLQNADGSCLWKSGSTHILCAVYGPVAPLILPKEDPNQAQVSVVIKSGSSNNNTVDIHELSHFLQCTLQNAIDIQQFPRCIVEVVLQVVQSDGSLLASLLHASVMALMCAGIDLHYTPVATTCLVTTTTAADSSVLLLLDPTAMEEEEEADSTLMTLVCHANQKDKLLGCHTIGDGVDLDTLLKCQQIAQKATPAIPAFWRLVLEQKTTREAQTLWSR